ncbi:universal stress protein [Streptomyces sp. NPDC048172]|uniref:universal stress protein n=1 Tax=Streptomyces sp. NPDC048172 TaxID=3365505 RepID=UPI0037200146
MGQPVIAGINGSPESVAAAAWAADEAVRRKSPLRLLFADEALQALRGGAPDTPPLPETLAPLEHSRTALRTTRDRLAARHPGLDVTVEERPEEPRQALEETSENAALTVLGSNGLGVFTGFMVGSVALSVLAHARGPVVLVREGWKDPERGNVVLGLDLERPCDDLIEFAFTSAAHRAVPLRVVHAWRLPLTYGYDPGIMEPGTGPEMERDRFRELASALRPWRNAFPAVEVAEQVWAGRAGACLAQAAQDASLVAVGRHRRHLPVGSAVGSVAHALLHHAPCPVAVVPHD